LPALVALLALVLGAALAQDARIDPGPTLPPALEARARAIGLELRCPVCRGLPIAESPADLARQMMGELRRQVLAGATDEQIQDFFVGKYGQSVLLNPPKRGLNLVIWLGPLVAVIAGGLALWSYLSRATRRPQPAVDPALLERVRQDLRERDPGGQP
jgi:cytochrome c-type biogenesis protein CcmH